MERIILPNEILLSEVAKLLDLGHTVTLRAKGNSMLPFIVSGRDSVVLHQTNKVQTGDIVLALLANGTYVLHRIHCITNDDITLMGDGNISKKEICKPEDVAGKVSVIIRNNHFVSCSSRRESYKVRCWKLLLPIRRYLLAIYTRTNPKINATPTFKSIE